MNKIDCFVNSFEHFVLRKRQERENKVGKLLDSLIILKLEFDKIESDKQEHIEHGMEHLSTEERKQYIRDMNEQLLILSDKMEPIKRKLRKQKYTLTVLMNREGDRREISLLF